MNVNYSFLLLLFSFFFTPLSYAEVLKTTSFIGGQAVEVLLKEHRDHRGSLIGIQLYEITTTREVGTAFLIHKNFYRFDANEVIEDVQIFRLKGFLSEKSAEIEKLYYTQRWSVDQKVAKAFDEQAAMLSSGRLTEEQKLKLYKQLDFYPFSKKNGDREREGEQEVKWLLGDQIIDDVEFRLAKSIKYGNQFGAHFISE